MVCVPWIIPELVRQNLITSEAAMERAIDTEMLQQHMRMA